MFRRRLLAATSGTLSIAIAGCAELTDSEGDELENNPVEVVESKLEAFEEGDRNKADMLRHSSARDSDVWNFEDYGLAENSSLEDPHVEVVEESSGRAIVHGAFTLIRDRGSSQRFELEFTLQPEDDTWQIFETEVLSIEKVDSGRVDFSLEEYTHDYVDYGIRMDLEFEYTDTDMLIHSRTSWGSDTNIEYINISGLLPNHSEEVGLIDYSKAYPADGAPNTSSRPFIDVAFTEGFEIPDANTDYPVLTYKTISDGEVEFEIELDELGIDDAREATADGESIRTPNAHAHTDYSATIDGSTLIVKQQAYSVAAFDTYDILITTVDEEIETTVSRPAIDTGTLDIVDIDFSDEGDEAVVKSVDVDVNLPSQQLDRYPHSLLITHVPPVNPAAPRTRRTIYTEDVKDAAEAAGNAAASAREKIPDAKVNLETDGMKTIAIEEIHQRAFEYPIESVDLLVTVLLGEVPLTTSTIELTSDDVA